MIFIVIVLTKHFIKRLRQRLGLKKKAIQRHLLKAVKNGLFLKGEDKRDRFYLDYHDKRYIISKENNVLIFITVFSIKTSIGLLSGGFPPYIPIEISHIMNELLISRSK